MLVIYADRDCKKRVEWIEWDSGLILTLINKKKITLENTSQGGETATATVYIRNEEEHRFGVTEITFPDERVKLKLEQPWLPYWVAVKLSISFDVPENPTPKDIIKAGKVKIVGYYIYEGR